MADKILSNDLIAKFREALDDHWGYIWGTAGIEWTAAKQKQKVDYMVNKYGKDWQKNADAKEDNYYKAALYGSKWIGHRVADCSGLFAWAFKQLGGSIAHGSNSIWDRYCSAKGKIVNGRKANGGELAPGTAMFTGTDKEKPHIGLYVGDGKVIEASGTQAGVCVSNLKDGKWKYWGELKNVKLEKSAEPVNPQEPAEERPTLRRGSKGDWVKLLQQELIRAGYDCGSYGADGDFGKATLAAVQKFQQENGLIVDGVVGPKTWEKLLAADAKPEKKYTATISGLTSAEAEKIRREYPAAKIAEEG